MIVVEGRRTRSLSRPEVLALAQPFRRVVVDLGTGDGRFPYAHATAHPDHFVVGIDALGERLAELSAKAARKPAKGGRANLLYVRASAEAPPEELHGLADEVHVLLPWGALLVGTMLATPEVLGGIVALARDGASFRVVFNAEVWEGSTPKDMADLPAVTVEYVERELVPAYAASGIALAAVAELSPDEVRDLPTTWARKLSHGRHPKFVAAAGTIGG